MDNRTNNDKTITELTTHPNFSDVVSSFCKLEFKDIKKGFSLRNRAIPKWYANEENWISADKTYYMPGLPICIKSAKTREKCSLLLMSSTMNEKRLRDLKN